VPTVVNISGLSLLDCPIEKTDGTIKNGQSRDIDNVGHTIPKGISKKGNPEKLATPVNKR
jgi:hypothetical protein